MGIFDAFRNATNKSEFEQAFGVEDKTTPEMRAAIRSWTNIYYDKSVQRDRNASDRLPFVIVDKLCKTMYGEYKLIIGREGRKADAMRSAADALEEVRISATQKALVGGEAYLKPFVQDGMVKFLPICRQDLVILDRDMLGNHTSIGLSEKTSEGSKHYTLLERRTATEGGLIIESKLYQSESLALLGAQVPLDTLEKYAGVEPYIMLETPYKTTGIVRMVVPGLNDIDGSTDGASIYSPAIAKIEEIYRHEALYEKEFENSASRIIASADMFRAIPTGSVDSTTGQPVKRKLIDDVFVALDDDPSEVGITIFNPTIRQEQYEARKTSLLRELETIIGFKRGILSEVEALEQTATQVTSSAGDYNTTIIQLQAMWTMAAIECIALADWLGQRYLGWSMGGYDEPIIDYDDGVLFNYDKTWNEYSTMVAGGLLRPAYFLAWYFNEEMETAEDERRILEKYSPEGVKAAELPEGGEPPEGDA